MKERCNHCSDLHCVTALFCRVSDYNITSTHYYPCNLRFQIQSDEPGRGAFSVRRIQCNQWCRISRLLRQEHRSPVPVLYCTIDECHFVCRLKRKFAE